jgi:hypothetical protein
MTDSNSERLQSLADEDHAESWKPEKDGDEIVGTFRRVTRGPDKGYGRPYIAILDTAGGPRSVWLLGQVLLDAFKEVRPSPGELVLVRYLGKRTSASDREYKAWKVVVDRDETVDWDRLDEDDDMSDAGGLPVADDDMPF